MPKFARLPQHGKSAALPSALTNFSQDLRFAKCRFTPEEAWKCITCYQVILCGQTTVQGSQQENQRLILFAATMSEMHRVPLVACSNKLVCKWLLVVIGKCLSIHEKKEKVLLLYHEATTSTYMYKLKSWKENLSKISKTTNKAKRLTQRNQESILLDIMWMCNFRTRILGIYYLENRNSGLHRWPLGRLLGGVLVRISNVGWCAGLRKKLVLKIMNLEHVVVKSKRKLSAHEIKVLKINFWK